MNPMKSHLGKMESELASWGAKVDDLVAKAKEVGADVKTERHAHIAELKAKHAVARKKLDELTAAGADEWDALKEGADGAWADLDAAYKKMTN